MHSRVLLLRPTHCGSAGLVSGCLGPGAPINGAETHKTVVYFQSETFPSHNPENNLESWYSLTDIHFI